MKDLSAENALKEFIRFGGPKWILDLIEGNQDLMRMLAVTMKSAQEVLESLSDREPEFFSINDAKAGINRMLETLPDAFMLSNIMFNFQMINKLLTAIAIEQLEKEKGVKDGAKVA